MGLTLMPRINRTGSSPAQLELRVGHETYVLRAGDRDFLPANTMHSAFVPGDEPVIYLIGAKH